MSSQDSIQIAPEHKRSFGTQQIHAGQAFDKATRAVAVPIYASTAFQFSDPPVEGEPEKTDPTWVYSRIANPTVSVFEDRMAALEGGVASVATATGNAATLLAILSLARCGDNIVVSTKLYGGTFQMFNNFFPRMGITAKFTAGSDAADFAGLIDDKTKAIYVESISNPILEVLDIAALATVARNCVPPVPLIVDNTFGAGGYLIRPIEHGADVVVHSATKWIGGHGTTLGGVVVSSGTFPFEGNERFPEFNSPLPGYQETIVVKEFGAKAHAFKMRMETLRDSGASLGAFAAFQLLQGLETLSLRMRQHVSTALALAQYLEAHPSVAWVSYPGLASHPSHERALKLLPRGSGGMLSFGLKPVEGKDPEKQAYELIYACRLAYHAPNVGDVRTLVAHPASSTQSQQTPEEQVKTGTTTDLIRISVGLEEPDDIIHDFEQALASLAGPVATASEDEAAK